MSVHINGYPSRQVLDGHTVQKKMPPPFRPQKPSMKRRMHAYDYRGRRIIMFTLGIQDRQPLLGRLEGRYNAKPDTSEFPRIIPTPLGLCVRDEWHSIPTYEPNIQLIAFQLMPNHIHGILFIKSTLDKHVGDVIGNFKKRCHKHFRRLCPDIAEQMQQTANSERGFLWELNYVDSVLSGEGQLRRMIDYVHDNPRRLALIQAFPDYFCHQMQIDICGLQFVAMGNRRLLTNTSLVAVHCRRAWNEHHTKEYQQQVLTSARQGSVLVSAFISPAEREVMKAAYAEGLPIIHLRANGFGELEKPTGQWFDYCAKGLLLELSPSGWPHVNGHDKVTRAQCVALNEMAETICKEKD